VFPGYEAPVLKARHGEIEDQISLARFGLIPSWAKDEKIARHTYNARCETVKEKPSFKAAYRERRFAVVLIDDFFEPCYVSGQAVRHRINIASGAPFGVACLWESWTRAQGEAGIETFSMLTLNADAHPVMNKMHAPGEEKRTPLVLAIDQFEEWLCANHVQAKALLTGARMPTLISAPAPKIPMPKAVLSVAKSEHTLSQKSLF
jgi:putative SOS response-associated peptidase YedK